MMPREQVNAWARLLRMCEEGKIEIHVSKIAAEEYRTKQRDRLIAEIEKTKSQIKSLRKSWKNNFFKDLLLTPPDNDILPSEVDILPELEEIDNLSLKNLDAWIQKNKITIVDPKPHHGLNAWNNYFAWNIPFRDVPIYQRNDDTQRDNRRKDIPDCWIYEAALDLVNEQVELICLCKDDNLANALKSTTKNVFKDAGEGLALIDILNNPQPEQPVVPRADIDDNAEQTDGSGRDLDAVLLNLHEEEKRLQIRILGYVKFFAPISDLDLTNLLLEKGHTEEMISNMIMRLTLSGLIANSGTSFLPGNKAVAEQAAVSVMAEITEIVGR